MHLRLPSVDPGVTALLWAVFFGAFIYFGMVAVGCSGAFSFVVSAVAAAAIWLFVRVGGERAD